MQCLQTSELLLINFLHLWLLEIVQWGIFHQVVIFSNILLNYFMCLKNLIRLTSDTTLGLINHNHHHLLVVFSVALLMSFVLRADPEGSFVSAIDDDGHTEEILHKIESSPAFLLWLLLSLVCQWENPLPS